MNEKRSNTLHISPPLYKPKLEMRISLFSQNSDAQ